MTLRWTVVWERLNKAAIKLNALTGTIVGTIGPNPPKSGVEVPKKLKEMWCRGPESNWRHRDFQSRIFAICWSFLTSPEHAVLSVRH